MLVSARPPGACLPLPRCAFAPLRLCLAAPLPRCAFASLPFDSLLHSPTEPSFCSFCEQKQRISGAVAHCSTWNTVHFVNRSSEAMEQCRSASRSISPCMRVGIWGTEASTIAPLRLAPLRLESLCHSGTAGHRQSAAARTHHTIKPLRRSAYASDLLFRAYARPLRIGSSIPRQRRRKMFKIGTPPENTDSQPLTIVY